MKHLRNAILAFVVLLSCSCSRVGRTVEDFNFDWKFTLGDNPEFAAETFDDSLWRPLHLPHDWSIEGEFSKDNPSTPDGGALPGGIGWYRKHFTVPALEGRRVFIEFDGVFMNSTVYVNGRETGYRPYGYSSFSYDISDIVREGDNLVAVRCDNADQPNSRWYSGCGIYRDVRLVTVNPVHVAYNGVFVTTPVIDGASASVRCEVEVEGGVPENVKVSILDADGRKVASSAAKPDSTGLWTAQMQVSDPRLWSLDDTYLYTAEVKVSGGDVYRTRFGFRTLDWDIDKGLFLNGERTFLYGVCLHHDMGCVGSAVHRRALERELGIMKEMGCNAIRTSHNPPSPVLLDLCDSMGFLVIDEAMDMWRKRKTQFDYARFFDEWHEKDVRDFMKRDRNHPCVMLWSVGNEVLEQWNTDGDIVDDLDPDQANTLINFMSSLPQYNAGDNNVNVVLARHMADIVRDMDTTRAVTGGLSETLPSNNLIKSGAIDVYGFNYHTYHYDSLRTWYPDKAIYASESASGLSSRGFYPQPSNVEEVRPDPWWIRTENEHHQCSSYDAVRAPWSDLHEHAWVAVRDHDFFAGCFVWTGFDYLGECTPYGWPSRSSYFGIVDLCGFPKDIYWMYLSEWRPDLTVLHLFPHWNWNEGDKVDMWCYYNNADEVELFVNGKSMGRSHKEGEQLRAQWLRVPWEPGCVEAVSYRDGVEVARESRCTSGRPVSLRLTPDRTEICADGYDLCYVTVEALDAAGNAVPDASDMISFSVEGAGELFGVDNGNSAGNLCLKGDRMDLFAGKALAVIRSLRGNPGEIRLSASAGCGTGECKIVSK